MGHTHVSFVDFIVHDKIIFYFIFTQFDALWELDVQKTTQGMVGGTGNHNNFWYPSIWYKSIQIGLNRT